MSKNKKMSFQIIGMILVVVIFISYSIVSMINEFKPSPDDRKKQEVDLVIDQSNNKKANDEFDVIIKEIEAKKAKKELEKSQPIKPEQNVQNKVKQQKPIAGTFGNEQVVDPSIQIMQPTPAPKKKEQKMVRYEDWVDETPVQEVIQPNENKEIENLKGVYNDEQKPD